MLDQLGEFFVDAVRAEQVEESLLQGSFQSVDERSLVALDGHWVVWVHQSVSVDVIDNIHAIDFDLTVDNSALEGEVLLALADVNVEIGDVLVSTLVFRVLWVLLLVLVFSFFVFLILVVEVLAVGSEVDLDQRVAG